MLESQRTHTLPALVLACLALLGPAAPGQASCGDCDERGNGVDVLDSLEAARIAVGLDAISGTQACTCDLDGTGLVDVIDALVLAQIAAGLPVTIVCGATCQGPCPGAVSFQGPATPVQCGRQADVRVDVDLGWCDLGAYQMRLTWDPSVLTLDPGFGTSGVDLTPPGAPEVVDDMTPGRVVFGGLFSCLSVFQTTIATVRFDVVGTPSSSTQVTLQVDDLARCDTTTIGPANPRIVGAITIDVAPDPCYVSCAATGAVSLAGPMAPVDCNDTFIVALDADLGTCDLGAYEFQLDWDPAVLEVDTTYGVDGVIESPWGAPAVVNPFTSGQLVFNGVFGGCPVLGVTTLATMRFRAIGAAASSTAISVLVRDLARCDTSPIGPGGPGAPIFVSVDGPSCGPGPVVDPIACGQLRAGAFATGLAVVDVADEATTDYFELAAIPAGTQELVISTSGTGDIDLYVGAPGVAGGSQVVGDYPLQSLSPTSSELVSVSALSVPALAAYGSGPVAIAVHAYAAGSYTLQVACNSTPPPVATQLACDAQATGFFSADGFGDLTSTAATEHFFIDTAALPAGLTELVISTGGASGDIDLYVGLPGTLPGSTAVSGYILLTGDSSHHSHVMPASDVAAYGGGDIAIAVHGDRQGDWRLRSQCLTPSSTHRLVRHYVYTVGAPLSTSISNSNPTGRNRFNTILEEWARVYAQSPAPELRAAFEVRQWSDSSANPYRDLEFSTEDAALAAYTSMFPTNPNRPPGPHTFFVESLTNAGVPSLGLSYLNRTGAPGSFGAGNAVNIGSSSFATLTCAEYTYLLGVAAAHECGHYMGLLHTTQFVLGCGGAVDSYDPYTDTPECVAGTPCAFCPDADYLMFPVIWDSGCPLPVSGRQDEISAQQEAAMETNPCVR